MCRACRCSLCMYIYVIQVQQLAVKVQVVQVVQCWQCILGLKIQFLQLKLIQLQIILVILLPSKQSCVNLFHIVVGLIGEGCLDKDFVGVCFVDMSVLQVQDVYVMVLYVQFIIYLFDLYQIQHISTAIIYKVYHQNKLKLFLYEIFIFLTIIL